MNDQPDGGAVVFRTMSAPQSELQRKESQEVYTIDGQASPATSDPNNDYKLVEEKISYVNVFFLMIRFITQI